MPPEPTPTYSGCARIFWIFGGPMLLAMIAFQIASNGGGWFTATDAVFFALLGALVLARWAEFHGGSPQTADGEPATSAHLRRYVVVAGGLGLVVWVIANVIGSLRAG
jgi:hypothetical protein